MESQTSKTESRRKFLKTAGKFAVYTPPALMLMGKANAYHIAKSPKVVKKRVKKKLAKRKLKRIIRRKRNYIVRRKRYIARRKNAA